MNTKTATIASEESPGSVPALDRTLDILETLSTAENGLTLSELSSHLQIPKNAVFRITQTLLARGYISRVAETMAFQLTSQWLKLATPRRGGLSLSEAAHPAMRALRDLTRETVQLGVLSGLHGTIIDQVEGSHSLRIVVDLGRVFKLHNNAPGKLLLAHMPDSQREEAISKITLTSDTPRTITSKAKLRIECQKILTRGYSIDHAEGNEGIHCIAAPIIDGCDGVVGAIWISGPAKRMPKSSFSDFGVQVMDAAREVSRVIEREK